MNLVEEIVEMREYVRRTGEGNELLKILEAEREYWKRMTKKKVRCPVCGHLAPAHLVDMYGCPYCYQE